MADQPGLDTGGIQRNFFTQVLDHFAEDSLSIFVGDMYHLRPHHSPQVLPLMKILGNVISHSLIQGGPGFPFLAPYVYWYVITASEETSLSYITREDLDPDVAHIVESVCSFTV